MRKSLFPILVLLACVMVGGHPQAAFGQTADNLTQFVNPRIGTGGHGHVFWVPMCLSAMCSWDLQSIRAVGTGARAIMSPTRC